MRILFSVLATLSVCAVAPVSRADAQHSSEGATLAPGQHVYAFRCPSNLLRIMFDGDRNIAEIHRFGRATITLSAQPSSGEGFHFANATYDLRGNLQEVQFRVGQAAARCRRGSLNG